MPNSVTIARAMSVARCRSFCAPVEISPKAISSARAAAEQHRELAEQIAARHQVAVLERQLHRVAERAEAALHDRDLVHRIEPGQRRSRRSRGPTRGRRRSRRSFVAHHALLLEAGDQPIDRLVEVRHVDRGLVLARREQRRLVDQVGEIGAGEARPCAPR